MDRKEKRQREHEKWIHTLMHNLYGHSIPTTKRKIVKYCWDCGLDDELQAIIAYGKEDPDYKLRLGVFAWQVYFLFRLTYQGKDGNYKKLPADRYARLLFLDPAETPEELYGRYFAHKDRDRGFRIYKAVCDCLCPMIAHNQTDDRFWPEHVAFLVDYIILRDGDVPKPDVEKMIVPYPSNYPSPWKQEKHILPGEIQI